MSEIMPIERTIPFTIHSNVYKCVLCKFIPCAAHSYAILAMHSLLFLSRVIWSVSTSMFIGVCID